MKKTPNPRFFLGLALLTLAVGGGGSYYQYTTLAAQTERIAQLRIDTRPLEEIEADLASATEKLSKTTAQLVHLEQGVPQFAYVPTLLYELEKLGNSTGLEVLGVRPVPPTPIKGDKKKKGAYEELDIDLKGRGDYDAVMNFVQALQTFPRIVEARTISLSPKSDAHKDGKPGLEVEVKLRAYLFPPPQGAEIKYGEVRTDRAIVDPTAAHPTTSSTAEGGSH